MRMLQTSLPPVSATRKAVHAVDLGESYPLVYATAQLMVAGASNTRARLYTMIRSYASFTAT